MLLINCSNREENCYKILNNIKKDTDKLISLSNKKMDFCLGCNKCEEKLDNYCIINDYITENVYQEIINAKDIVLASPLYMSNINGILKNLIDRLLPFYKHHLLKDKTIYLILTGNGTKECNKEEIEGIISYFNGISEWVDFSFTFLDYFEDNNSNYNNQIESIKKNLEDIK